MLEDSSEEQSESVKVNQVSEKPSPEQKDTEDEAKNDKVGQDSNYGDKHGDENRSENLPLHRSNDQDVQEDQESVQESQSKFKREKIVQLQDDIQRYLQHSSEDDHHLNMPMLMDDAWMHQRIDKDQGSSVIIMGQSERSELVTNRLFRGDDHNAVLRREDLNSGGNTAEKRNREKPLQTNYLEVIQDDSEEKAHVVHLLHERSNSFFIDGSVAQTERQAPTTKAGK